MKVHYTVSRVGMQMYGEYLWTVRRYSFSGLCSDSRDIAYFPNKDRAKDYAKGEARREGCD